MTAEWFRKQILNKGDILNQVTKGDSIKIRLQVYEENKQIDKVSEGVFVLCKEYVPEDFIILASSMLVNEESEFFIVKEDFNAKFSSWINITASFNVYLRIIVLQAFKPVDIFQDGNYI